MKWSWYLCVAEDNSASGARLAINRSWVWLTAVAVPGVNPGQVIHMYPAPMKLWTCCAVENWLLSCNFSLSAIAMKSVSVWQATALAMGLAVADTVQSPVLQPALQLHLRENSSHRCSSAAATMSVSNVWVLLTRILGCSLTPHHQTVHLSVNVFKEQW